jgi:hypothetical protein
MRKRQLTARRLSQLIITSGALFLAVLGMSLAANHNQLKTLRSVQADRNAHVLRLDSLLAVKLLGDKALAESYQQIRQYRTENDQLRTLLTDSEEETTAYQRLAKILLEKSALRTVLDNQSAKSRRANQQLESEIASVKQLLINLSEENDSLQTAITQLQTSEAEQQQMYRRAAGLQAHSIRAETWRCKAANRRRPTTRAAQVDYLTVRCEIAENLFATPGPRQIFLLITDPSGAVLTRDPAENRASFYGNEQLYTVSSRMDYQNKPQTLHFTWNHPMPYKPGEYTIEIFADDRLIGQSGLLLW